MQKANLHKAIGVAAGLAVITLFFWYGMPTIDSESKAKSPTPVITQDQLASIKDSFKKLSPAEEDYLLLASGVQVYELVVGDGPAVEAGKSVSVHYVARFEDGVQFDSSIDYGQPLVFTYGDRQLIPGFEAGISDAKVGSVRRVVVPARLGYDKKGVVLEDGTVIIPPDAVLIFDIAVVNVE